jgi:hypothetical protein
MAPGVADAPMWSWRAPGGTQGVTQNTFGMRRSVRSLVRPGYAWSGRYAA